MATEAVHMNSMNARLGVARHDIDHGEPAPGDLRWIMICRWAVVYMINAWAIHISILQFIFDTPGLASTCRSSTGVDFLLFVRHLETAGLYTPLLHSRHDSQRY